MGIHHGHHERATPTGLVQFWGLEGPILVRNDKASFLGVRLGWGSWERGLGGLTLHGCSFCWGDERVLDIDSGDGCMTL